MTLFNTFDLAQRLHARGVKVTKGREVGELAVTPSRALSSDEAHQLRALKPRLLEILEQGADPIQYILERDGALEYRTTSTLYVATGAQFPNGTPAPDLETWMRDIHARGVNLSQGPGSVVALSPLKAVRAAVDVPSAGQWGRLILEVVIPALRTYTDTPHP